VKTQEECEENVAAKRDAGGGSYNRRWEKGRKKCGWKAGGRRHWVGGWEQDIEVRRLESSRKKVGGRR
jgi:hypothetical protein